MQINMTNVDLTKKSVSELEELLKQKKEEMRQAKIKRQDAYEGLRNGLLNESEPLVRAGIKASAELYDFCINNLLAFRSVMSDYGHLRREDQFNYKINNESFRIEVKSCKVKCFDERADVAASKLIDFLRRWMRSSKSGADDVMYQLAMTLLERNRYGDLDYKSISKLYKYEDRFNDPEYSEIMSLFKESDTVEKTSTNFYFYERTELGVWRKLEPSFNMM